MAAETITIVHYAFYKRKKKESKKKRKHDTKVEAEI